MADTPLRLHGYPVSNYFNVARAALIEKGLKFEVVQTRATQDEAFLALSPMGKVPVLETADGWIAETVAIVEYLDDRYPQQSLRPADLGNRAKARQIVNVVQMYIETPARSLFAGVFGGGTNGPQALAAARTTLDRSTRALARLMHPDPFLFGTEISSADLFAFYNLDIADRVTRFVYDRSIIEEIGTLSDWHVGMKTRTSSHVVLTDFERYFGQYLKDHGAVFRAGAQGHLNHA